jgi:hypothetical protein
MQVKDKVYLIWACSEKGRQDVERRRNYSWCLLRMQTRDKTYLVCGEKWEEARCSEKEAGKT